MRVLLPSFLFLASLSVTGTAVAADRDPPSLNQLVNASDIIVVGKIVKTTQVDRENELADISYNNTKRYTAVIATVQVEEPLRGEPGASVKFTYPKRARVSGEPVYDLGMEGVWLLRKSDKRDEYIADTIGRYQPKERKEQVRAILTAAKGGKRGGDDDDK